VAADLRWDFYADANLIRESFARGRAANLIHLVTAWKFDLFPPGKDEYSETEFGRPSFREIQPDGAEKVECAVASGEDTVLRKVVCYRAGGESSENIGTICSVSAGRWANDWMFFTFSVGPVI
jgi:hypothetical protein